MIVSNSKILQRGGWHDQIVGFWIRGAVHEAHRPGRELILLVGLILCARTMLFRTLSKSLCSCVFVLCPRSRINPAQQAITKTCITTNPSHKTHSVFSHNINLPLAEIHDGCIGIGPIRNRRNAARLRWTIDKRRKRGGWRGD